MLPAAMKRVGLRHLAVIAALGLFPAAAYAGFYSGTELHGICTADRSDPTYVEKTYECIAYITGAVDAFNTTRAANNLKSCIPPKVTISQLKEVTVAYLADNPKSLDKSASMLVFAATRQKWPCGKKK